MLISLALLIFILGAIFTVAYFYAKRIPDYSLVFTGSFAMAIALLFLYPLRKFFEKLANKYFFTSLYNYQATLEDLANKLTKVIEMPKVIDLIVNTIKNTMGLDRAGVLILSNERNAHRYLVAKVIGFNEQNGVSLVRDNFLVEWLTTNKKPAVFEELERLANETQSKEEKSKLMRLKTNMKRIEASLCLPLFAKKGLISIIVLGNKVTGDAYTVEDLRLLQTIANQASVAIENARSYQEIQDYNKTLQQKVDEQTKDVKKANTELKRMLEIQSSFLDITSHQLRTPVSLIRGIISMMLEGDLAKLPQAKQNEFLQTIKDKSDKLEVIINDILSASDFDSQKFAVRPNSPQILLEDVVDAAVEDAEQEAKQRNIELKWRKPRQPLGKIAGEEKYLEQAIYNLISNALKYTPSTEMVLVV